MFNNVRKAVVSGVGTLLTVLVFASENLGVLLPGSVEVILGGAIAVLTPIATYLIRPGKGLVTPEIPKTTSS